VDKAEAKKYYGYDLVENPFTCKKQYDAIIVAVGHGQFVSLSEEDYTKLANVIIDVKGIVKNPTWRL
jgi:UDP-N-acetyl-D-glucosamine/UDP-N-acetyl-D-galactosamine dehydrogenase